ncbi:MAG: hypothetical protein ACHQJ6_08105 [Candidatus Berkiellales bacterium]
MSDLKSQPHYFFHFLIGLAFFAGFVVFYDFNAAVGTDMIRCFINGLLFAVAAKIILIPACITIGAIIDHVLETGKKLFLSKNSIYLVIILGIILLAGVVLFFLYLKKNGIQF